jgi:iron complex transport system permease protein
LPRQFATAALVCSSGSILLLVLLLIHLTQGQAKLNFGIVLEAILSPDNSDAHNLIRYLQMPRAVIGVLAGIALGIAGVLFQTTTRNPLASPTTLGVNAGAYLAVVAGTIFAPKLFAAAPVLVAFAGGLLAALLVYAIAASVQVTPIRLVLAGVAVSLTLAAFTAALQLFYENETAGLFLWGAGSLVQTDWSGTTYALPQVLIGAAVAMLLTRTLDVLLLGDEVARSLGQRVQLVRLLAIAIGVFLAAVVTSVVGAIGFVGLVAPHIVRLMGVRQHLFLLPGAAIWGAVLVIGADVAARLMTTNVSELAAGSVTALIGAPFLIWLARQTKRPDSGATSDRALRVDWRTPSYPVLLGIAVLLLLAALIVGTAFGDVYLSLPEIIQSLTGNGSGFSRQVLFDLRLSRLLVGMLAGASLAVSGLLLQGVVRNPLAGPEIVGITSGAGLSVLLVLVLVDNAPVTFVPIAAMFGAFAAFGVVCAASWQDGLTAARLALVGIAVSAFCSASTNLLVVQARLQVAQALVWLSGSTYARSWDELRQLIAWPLILLPLAWGVARWLDIMALGDDFPKVLGIQLQQARLILLAIAVALAAAAVSTVGTISFVGLVAPHAARLLVGSHHRKLVPLSALLGAILVVVADTIGRTALAPKEIPAGLVTAMIGTPYFLWLLWQSRTRSAHKA